MKKLITLGLVFLFAPFVAPLVFAVTDLSIQPSVKKVLVDDIFVININIDTTDLVAGAAFDIVFDKALLEAQSVAEGGFLSQNGDQVFDINNNIDNPNGKVTFYMMIQTKDKGVNGQGSLADITFKALQEGITDLELQNVLIGDYNAQSVDFTISNNGVVEIYDLKGDLNGDFAVNILDLIIARNSIGSSPGDQNWDENIDVNQDQSIDLLDLITIRNNFT